LGKETPPQNNYWSPQTLFKKTGGAPRKKLLLFKRGGKKFSPKKVFSRQKSLLKHTPEGYLFPLGAF